MKLQDAVSAAPTALTIGKFDGVHIGHQAILRQLTDAAGARQLVPTVVTFDRHPLSVVRPEVAPLAITSLAQRRELLHQHGVEQVVELTFDRELMSTDAAAFVEALFQSLKAKWLFVGADFTFGSRARGNTAMLQAAAPAYGAEVVIIDDICVLDGRRVSSSWIRDALALGRVEDAADMLGRPHAVRGEVVRGEQRGRLLGYPTANLEPHPEGLVPADGIYAAWATIAGERHPAAVSVGNNPTFAGDERVVEAHLIDTEGDYYGEQLTVEFVRFLRTMHRFDGEAALIEQMARDVDEARAALTAEA